MTTILSLLFVNNPIIVIIMFRKLNQAEIEVLRAQGCMADDWATIEVVEDFSPEYVRNVLFTGNCRVGRYTKSFDQPGGVRLHAGLYGVHLHNVSVGNECYIHNVRNYIANYDIADNVFIENTNIIVVDGETTFGNGVRVPVMNETGGREVMIYDRLSAQTAYILSLYRHDTVLIEKLEGEIGKYTETRRSTRGVISEGVRIINCSAIKNVYIGPHASIMGASKLSNGSINSNECAPVHIGSGVKCTDFILSSGTNVTDSTLVSRCFVGQGSVMGKHYSALDSLFFANCQGFHGEATAIFAGPYTVTHHKSTLLIAGMYSFLNAGSGSNQSNHMYKLGPIHQGLVERGSKTTSDSYILWPARIGAFTLIMGRHTKNSDTSDLPFSYLIENATESYLVPAVNIQSVGTVRDAKKWPKRDNRTDKELLDLINYNLLSPYTVQKMYRGVEILEQLREMSGANNEIYTYHNCKIRNSSLVKGLGLYRMAIMKFLGNSLISRIHTAEYKSFAELKQHLVPTTEKGAGEWVDIAGLIAPKREIEALISDVKSDRLTLPQIERRMAEIHEAYYEYEWTWAYSRLTDYWGKPIDAVTPEDLLALVEEWRETVVELDRMLYNDAKKEFNLSAKTGFGIDGDEDVKRLDFESVRGKFEENTFVKECLEHIERKSKLAEETVGIISGLA